MYGLAVTFPSTSSPHRAEVSLIMKQKAIHASTTAFALNIMIVITMFLIFGPSALLGRNQDFSFFFVVLSLLMGLSAFSVWYVTYAFNRGFDASLSLMRIQV